MINSNKIVQDLFAVVQLWLSPSPKPVHEMGQCRQSGAVCWAGWDYNVSGMSLAVAVAEAASAFDKS